MGELAYLGFDEWADDSDGHLNLVHFGWLHHPVLGRRDVCFKMFPLSGTGRRGLLNEITGWLLAEAAALPQPGFACVVNVPLARIKPVRGWLKNLTPQYRTWPAFCTERLPYRSAAVQFSGIDKSATLRTELLQWPHSTNLAAVDEHLGYADRHFNNLLRAASRQFMVIDFDRLATLPGSPDWTLATLDSLRQFDNQLTRRLWNDQPSTQLACEMLDVAAKHTGYFNAMASELLYWCKGLLTDTAEQASWYRFIAERAGLVVWLLQQRFRLLSETLH